jgi:hypothetical protein
VHDVHLVGDANDTASGTRTSVTSLLGLLVSALAEVVSAAVHDNGALWHLLAILSKEICWSRTYANDTLGADQLDQLVRVASLSIALAVGLEVAQVTDVALVVLGGAVGLVVRVD